MPPSWLEERAGAAFVAEVEAPGIFVFTPPADKADAAAAAAVAPWIGNPRTLGAAAADLPPAQRRKHRQLLLIEIALRRARVRYATVAEIVGIDAADIEPFLVEALLDGAIAGRIDALTQTLHVHGVAARNPTGGGDAHAVLARVEAAVHGNVALLRQLMGAPGSEGAGGEGAGGEGTAATEPAAAGNATAFASGPHAEPAGEPTGGPAREASAGEASGDATGEATGEASGEATGEASGWPAGGPAGGPAGRADAADAADAATAASSLADAHLAPSARKRARPTSAHAAI